MLKCNLTCFRDVVMSDVVHPFSQNVFECPATLRLNASCIDMYPAVPLMRRFHCLDIS